MKTKLKNISKEILIGRIEELNHELKCMRQVWEDSNTSHLRHQ